MIQPVQRRSVPDDVFEQLAAEMVAGLLQPGAALPSERKLAELLGVSRPAVREALQRLAQAGLVEVRQGDTTTVRDYRRHGGLELLPTLLVVGGELDLGVVRSLLEARQLIGPQVAALAAAKVASTGQPLDLLHEEVRRLGTDDDPVRRQRHALAFWDHVVDAADSIAFRLMFNSMRAAYEPAIEALAGVLAAEVDQVETYLALAEALTAGDAPGAEQAARAVLEPGTQALIRTIELLDGADPDSGVTTPDPKERP